MLLEIGPLDYVRSGAVTVGLLACMLAGARTWQIAFSAVMAGFGLLMYFGPSVLLEYQTEPVPLDKHHFFLVQVAGGQMFANAVIGHFCQVVSTSYMLSWLLWGVINFQAGVFNYLKANKEEQRLGPTFVTFGLLTCLVMTIGNGYYAFRNISYAGGTISFHNRINIHIFIDVLFLLSGLFLDYTYPEEMFLHAHSFKPDGIHVCLVHYNAVLMLLAIIFGLRSLTFSDDKDKRIYLLGRLTLMIFNTPLLLLGMWQGDIFAPGILNALVPGLLLSYVNVILGYFYPISLPKFKGE